MPSIPDDLQAEIALEALLGKSTPAKGKGKGPGRASTLAIEIVRPLTSADVDRISGNVIPRVQPGILRVTARHHQLAQLMAQEKTIHEISLITGYTYPYVCAIKKDPAFQELMTYYAQTKTEVFVDLMERMKNLGVSAIEELQDRLDSEPEEWKKSELMELARLMALEPMKAKMAERSGGGGEISINFGVKFVQPGEAVRQGPGPALGDEGSPIIDAEFFPIEPSP